LRQLSDLAENRSAATIRGLVLGNGISLTGGQRVEHPDDLDRREFVISGDREHVDDLRIRLTISGTVTAPWLGHLFTEPGRALFHRESPDETSIAQLLAHSSSDIGCVIDEFRSEPDRRVDQRLERCTREDGGIDRFGWLL